MVRLWSEKMKEGFADLGSQGHANPIAGIRSVAAHLRKQSEKDGHGNGKRNLSLTSVRCCIFVCQTRAGLTQQMKEHWEVLQVHNSLKVPFSGGKFGVGGVWHACLHWKGY